MLTLTPIRRSVLIARPLRSPPARRRIAPLQTNRLRSESAGSLQQANRRLPCVAGLLDPTMLPDFRSPLGIIIKNTSITRAGITRFDGSMSGKRQVDSLGSILQVRAGPLSEIKRIKAIRPPWKHLVFDRRAAALYRPGSGGPQDRRPDSP